MENTYFQLNIQNYLSKNRLTISKLAKLIKVNEYNLNHLITRNIISVSHPIIIEISKFFNCSLYELFKEPEYEKNFCDDETKLTYNLSKINVDLFFKDEKVAEAFVDI
ncbi:MAG: helix-turn-helix domain-containing protein [Alphaproteobacteria bacterium]